MPNTIGF